MSPHARLLVVLTLVAAGLVPGLVTAGGARADAAAPSERSAATYVAQVRRATNAERTKRQIRPLRANACLQKAAQRQADRMARSGRLHHSPDFGAIGRRCGLRAWGENVAQGGGNGRAVVRRWMASSGHRANILNRDYRIVGIAAVRARGTWWAVQVFGRKM
ncbi:CAP domain-containing protein [Nocardioides sp. C4-1]|uniref:CAP domain-containing protein n=1 Tax=Nocardioides sp. C4-1 TaxID=3151851 RepID=UPI0032672B2E